MSGGVSSLNVSAAGAVVLYEAFRQRALAARRATDASPRPCCRVETKETERPGFMRFLLGRFVAIAIAITGMTAFPLAAQTAPTTPPPAPPQQTQPHQGQVIFSRSTDENGQTTTQSGPAAAPPADPDSRAPPPQDADRQAVTFTAFDLDVHLRPAEQHIAVRAQLTVRNDGKTPLTRIPLQLSSSLNWERIRVRRHPATRAFQVATLNSDADHTGQLHEAALFRSLSRSRRARASASTPPTPA